METLDVVEEVEEAEEAAVAEVAEEMTEEAQSAFSKIREAVNLATWSDMALHRFTGYNTRDAALLAAREAVNLATAWNNLGR